MTVVARTRPARAIFGVVLVIAGALTLIVAVLLVHQTTQFKAWAQVDATVVGVSHTTKTVGNNVGGVSLLDLYAPTLQFVVADQQHTVTGDYTSAYYVVGQVVGVFIKPGDSSTVLLQPPPDHLTMALVLGGLGLVVIGLGGWSLGRRRDSSDVNYRNYCAT